MNARLTPQAAASVAPLRVAYRTESLAQALARPDTLAAIGFGAGTVAASPDPRALHVALAAPAGAAPLEVWQAEGPVRAGRQGAICHAASGDWQFAAVELEETDFGDDIARTAEAAYRELAAFQQGGAHPHLVRVWNYLDAITLGQGDAERYRQFCVGRARGLGTPNGRYPAATAIGRRDGRRRLQVYWLASRLPAHSIENPRQVSAFHYPRCYGPQPPSFARASLMPVRGGAELFISGTAAVVGHESRHPGRLAEQALETLDNLQALRAAAAQRDAGLGNAFGAGTVLKAYLRPHGSHAQVEALLRRRLPADVGLLLLEADICRTDLLIEIDGIHCVA